MLMHDHPQDGGFIPVLVVVQNNVQGAEISKHTDKGNDRDQRGKRGT